ncbi:MAG: prealbumin-like fold domain-containing protein [Thermomicrobiales bacterium]
MTGTVVITKTDESGNLLAGACFTVNGQEICDNGAGDANADDGTIEVSGVPAGDVVIAETVSPQGYAGAADPQTVTLTDGDVAQVAFINTRQVGTLRIEKTNEAGEFWVARASPLPEQRFAITVMATRMATWAWSRLPALAPDPSKCPNQWRRTGISLPIRKPWKSSPTTRRQFLLSIDDKQVPFRSAPLLMAVLRSPAPVI